MKKTKEIYIEDGYASYRYSVTKVGSVRVVNLEKDNGYGEWEEDQIIIAKAAGWYYMAFPDMGTASPGFSDLGDYGLVADLVHDAGYWNPDTEAITLAIMDVAKSGF